MDNFQLQHSIPERRLTFFAPQKDLLAGCWSEDGSDVVVVGL